MRGRSLLWLLVVISAVTLGGLVFTRRGATPIGETREKSLIHVEGSNETRAHHADTTWKEPPDPYLVPSPPTDLAKVQKPGGPYNPADPRWQWWRWIKKKDPGFEWKMPIDFYGKVVDQEGNPVAGATARLGWTDTSGKGYSKRILVSDHQGRFSMRGERGKRLEAWVSKDGYYSCGGLRGEIVEFADFSDSLFHRPDPDNPVIFRLRKKGNAEPLVVGRAELMTKDSGETVSVTMVGVPFEISLWGNRDRYPKSPFDWGGTIRIPGGGFLHHEEEFPFLAPEVGYQETLTFDMPKGAQGWRRDIRSQYFIAYGEPRRYGRIEMDVSGSDPRILVKYWLNPSGSRNLEFDPARVMNEPQRVSGKARGPLFPPK